MNAECNQFVLGFHPLKRREIRAEEPSPVTGVAC
jgi:hypothetical protein